LHRRAGYCTEINTGGFPLMPRQCTCGGLIRQHELTGDREAWTCGACGRYCVIDRAAGREQSGLLIEKDCVLSQDIVYTDEVNAGGIDESRPLNEGLLPGEPGRAASTESNSLRGFAFQDGVL
jgi:hypothetical protein